MSKVIVMMLFLSTINIIMMCAVYYRLYQISMHINTVTTSLDTIKNVINNLRIVGAGSLVEKATLVKDGYIAVKNKFF